ncbi:MAG: 6-phosphogluconolactonase [Sphaerobacter thermophilus]|jgi:6-phosphogluconolactonase|uniref:6-phosphogluconolactonase n=1 Tax=Sphaerobacter thermophilus (strain ATCC 49802 / DSM 20745 / KCCM 41009 / NCIMB 13125 / S 6022) TaxID=479434 RepID=D1C7Y2_SPHTD|nr:6-phosphogluconolactonase [Sphaerobacter thermophilus]ACZ39853.1 6-phosphogluconolactonase [Sphaerobacter thermophilus DSM 20745]PZN65063.1 MAG: 6-phosphogluconolactonase [Sphaerobacter thermophilus]
MREQTVVVVPDAEALAEAAARRFVAIAREQIAQRERFTVALSGGSTPRALYRLLAEPPQADAIDWSRVHVFWSDERCVPPDHEQSNYRMARETLLDHVPIPHDQIHRIEAEREPSDAAAHYAATLTRVFGLGVGEMPDFGLILLGIGADGHTASLFPGTRALTVRGVPVVENVVPQLDTMRITLTVPVITEAANIMVLAAGEDKAPAVHRALEAPYAPEQTPAQFIRTASGTVIWLLDEAAASQLTGRGPAG